MSTHRVFRLADGEPDTYRFNCPGCGVAHEVRAGRGAWSFNGDLERPTFSPSVKVTVDLPSEDGPGEETILVCHSFIRAGVIDYLSDCTHHLAGKRVLLPEARPVPAWDAAPEGTTGFRPVRVKYGVVFQWLSLCSAHAIYDHSCPRCRAGRWYHPRLCPPLTPEDEAYLEEIADLTERLPSIEQVRAAGLGPPPEYREPLRSWLGRLLPFGLPRREDRR